MDLDALMKGMGPIKEALAKAQEERMHTVLEGSAGGGAVRVRIGGDLVVKAVELAPAAAVAAEGDAGMIEDLIQAAIEDALRKYREQFGTTPEEQIQKALGSTGLGAMFGG